MQLQYSYHTTKYAEHAYLTMGTPLLDIVCHSAIPTRLLVLSKKEDLINRTPF